MFPPDSAAQTATAVAQFGPPTDFHADAHVSMDASLPCSSAAAVAVPITMVLTIVLMLSLLRVLGVVIACDANGESPFFFFWGELSLETNYVRQCYILKIVRQDATKGKAWKSLEKVEKEIMAGRLPAGASPTTFSGVFDDPST